MKTVRRIVEFAGMRVDDPYVTHPVYGYARGSEFDVPTRLVFCFVLDDGSTDSIIFSSEDDFGLDEFVPEKLVGAEWGADVRENERRIDARVHEFVDGPFAAAFADEIPF